MSENRSLSRLRPAVAAVFTSLALSFNMAAPATDNSLSENWLGELMWNLRRSLAAKQVTVCLLFFSLFFFYRFVSRRRKRANNWFFLPVSVALGLVWLMAESLCIDNSLHSLTASMGQIFKSGIYLVGVVCGLNALTHFLYDFFHSEAALPEHRAEKSGILGAVHGAYDRHPFLSAFFGLFLVWLPHLVVSYPASFCWDAVTQLRQYYGMAPFTSHHPPFSTLLMGSVVRIGAVFGGNAGLFLYIVLQTLLYAGVMAYMMLLMRRLHSPEWLLLVTFCFCALSPYYTSYIGVFLKDNTYSCAFVLYLVELIDLLVEKDKYYRSKLHLFLWCVSVVGVILLRNNGKYVIYPMTALLLVRDVRTYLKTKKMQPDAGRFLTAKVAMLLVPVLLAAGVQGAVFSHYSVQKGSIAEALSLPFQQTARYVKEHGDEMTDKERKAIDGVLDCENLADLYDPRISDPVKRTYRGDDQALVPYIRVWLRQFLRHPMTYVSATINQNYYVVYPFVPNDVIFDRLYFTDHKKVNELWERLGAHEVEGLTTVKRCFSEFDRMCYQVPVLGLLSHPATHILLLLWLSLFAVIKKRWDWLVAAGPGLLTLAIIILSPVIQLHPRYAFPIIYTTALIVAYYFYLQRGESVTAPVEKE